MNSNTPASGRWRTFGLAATVVFMVSLDATVVVAAFPALRLHFAEASPASLSWALNGYTIVYAALLMAGGRLADRFGNRRCFLHGLALFTVASVGCAFAGGAAWLATARVLQAIGAALLTPASLALVLAEFPSAERQRAVNLWSAVGALAAAIGPMAGSAIIEWFSWPMIFLINLPVGIVAWWRARKALPEVPPIPEAERIDLPGTVLVIVGVAAIAFGLVTSGESGGSPWRTPAAWILGGAAWVAYGWNLRRGDRPSSEVRLFHSRDYRWASLATLVFGAAFSAGFLAFYLFTTGIWHYPQSRAGLAATPGPVLVIGVAILMAGRVAQIGRRTVLIAGGLLYAASNLWFCAMIRAEPDFLTTWLPGQLASGAAIGLLLPTLTGAALAGLAPGNFAVGNAVNTAVRLLGGSLGVALAVAVVGAPDAGLERFRLLYGGLAVSGLLVALLALPLERSAAPILPDPKPEPTRP